MVCEPLVLCLADLHLVVERVVSGVLLGKTDCVICFPWGGFSLEGDDSADTFASASKFYVDAVDIIYHCQYSPSKGLCLVQYDWRLCIWFQYFFVFVEKLMLCSEAYRFICKISSISLSVDLLIFLCFDILMTGIFCFLTETISMHVRYYRIVYQKWPIHSSYCSSNILLTA